LGKIGLSVVRVQVQSNNRPRIKSQMSSMPSEG
jgi:hypothetical protein